MAATVISPDEAAVSIQNKTLLSLNHTHQCASVGPWVSPFQTLDLCVFVCCLLHRAATCRQQNNLRRSSLIQDGVYLCASGVTVLSMKSTPLKQRL